jgi:hypothetical protein
MLKILNSLFSRIFVRAVGLNVRYFYFRLIGKPKNRNQLSNSFKDDYDDYSNAVNQDILNTIVGSVVLLIIAISILLI